MGCGIAQEAARPWCANSDNAGVDWYLLEYPDLRRRFTSGMPTLRLPAIASYSALGLPPPMGAIPFMSLRGCAIGGFIVALLFLGRSDLNEQTLFGDSRGRLSVQPDPAEISTGRCGVDRPQVPMVYIEDPYQMGNWWYGMGYLMTYIYLRDDIEEKVVPSMPTIPEKDWREWGKREHAYYFYFDDAFHWKDLSESFRWRVHIGPPMAHVSTGGEQKFQANVRFRRGVVRGSAHGEKINDKGLYRAPWARFGQPNGTLFVDPPAVNLAPGEQIRFSAFANREMNLNVVVREPGTAQPVGKTSVRVDQVSVPEVVRWSVDPPDAGTISADGLYTAPTHPGKVTIRGIGFTDPARPGRATVSVGEFVPILIRAGTDADYGYESGSAYSSTAAVSGTSTPEVYQSERF